MNSTSYQAPDTAAKTQAGLDSDYQAETDDLLGEKMVLNMGPFAPSYSRRAALSIGAGW